MAQALITIGSELGLLPVLFAPDALAAKRTLEFLTAHIRNSNTRKTYAAAIRGFAGWCVNQRGPLCIVLPVKSVWPHALHPSK